MPTRPAKTAPAKKASRPAKKAAGTAPRASSKKKAAGKAGASTAKKSAKAAPKTSARPAAKKRGASAGAGAAPPAPAPSAAVSRNGLRSFSMHKQDRGTLSVVAAIRPSLGARFEAAAAAPPPLSSLDAETVARQYLNNALESEQLPAFSAAPVSGERSEFKTISTEAVPLTGTQVVKFSQYYRKIPVYGSLVTVELDKKNEFVALNSAISEPTNVNPLATVSPAAALEKVRERAGYTTQHLDATPRVYYYFDRQAQRWRLAYITTDVVKIGVDRDAEGRPSSLPQVMDYVVDAHSGELVAELPRTQNLTETAVDGLRVKRRINVVQMSAKKQLSDPALNIHTHDFGFRNINDPTLRLPGDYVAVPPVPWSPAAVSAHANAADVVKYLSAVLKRNGVDNLGGPLVSTINCVEEDGTQAWDNAMWYKRQMMYGQSRMPGGGFRSWAVAKDIVAHEIAHGITDHTARIEYLGESGALNESYADIFGVIIGNSGEPNVAKWDWRIGGQLTEDGTPLRDMRRPRLFEQPDHMRDYVRLPNTAGGDWGGVHVNSGIHNKAAYNVLTAKSTAGRYLFKPETVAALFYLALTHQLSRTARFTDSRRGVELSARTLLAADPGKNVKLRAVARAFDRVGIAQG